MQMRSFRPVPEFLIDLAGNVSADDPGSQAVSSKESG
jgi:hypothetical protein